jgi:hypothetical protein
MPDECLSLFAQFDSVLILVMLRQTKYPLVPSGPCARLGSLGAVCRWSLHGDMVTMPAIPKD